MNKLAALAFIHPNDVSQAFEILHNSLPQILNPLLNYFEDTYIGRLRANGRASALFDINFWNMHQRTTDLLMRTNNAAESWHRRLSSIIQCQHPTLWTFIHSLKNEETFIPCQILKLNVGEKIEPNKKYLNYSKRLRHMILHPLPTLLEQLDGLAHNL